MSNPIDVVKHGFEAFVSGDIPGFPEVEGGKWEVSTARGRKPE